MYDRSFTKERKIMELSIIVPIKCGSIEAVEDFTKYIVNLSTLLSRYSIQILIADECDSKVYDYMNDRLHAFENVEHFIPEAKYRVGQNDKSNGVCAAVDRCKYDNILLVDDHYRLTKNTILSLEKYYEIYDVFKCMPKFDNAKMSVLIDMCGMFVVNMLDYRKQYCGHLALTKSPFVKNAFPCRDSLFDEFAFEKYLRNCGYKVGFVRDIALEATQNISTFKFLEQRIRYAYENMCMPVRFALELSVLPLMLALYSCSKIYALFFFLSLTGFILIVALIGQKRYNCGLYPKTTFLLGPLWYWHYPITSWIALICYFTGGVYFGGRKVKKP